MDLEQRKPYSLTVSRPSRGDGRESIVVEVRCNKARLRFLELELDLRDFAMLMTGLSEVPCEGLVTDLNHVGKEKKTKQIVFEIYNSRDREEAMEKVEDFLVNGYEKCTGFNSQNSFFKKDGKNYARTNIIKWG